MDQTATLIAAIGALWTALLAQTMPLPTEGQSAWQWIAVVAVTALWLFTVGAMRYLVADGAAKQKRCDERIAKLETKLDDSSDLIRRQAESMQKQIEAQGQLIAGLQSALGHQAGGSP